MAKARIDPAEFAGANNALWRHAEDLISNSPAQIGEFQTELQQIPSVAWQKTFGSAFVAQARALADGTVNVALAVGQWSQGNRGEFFKHLASACRAYQSAFEPSQALPDPPFPPDLSRLRVEQVPERCLAHLDSKDCWRRDPPEYFPGLGMVRSALADLLSSLWNDLPTRVLPSQPVWHVHLPLLFVGPHSRGIVKELTLEWFQMPGRGLNFFPDPKALGCSTLDEDFRRGLENAWKCIRKSAPREFLRDCWVRWRIEDLSKDDRWLTGGSASGAFAAALWGVAHRQRFDRVGLTATVDEDGNLGSVEAVAAKLSALVQNHAEQLDTGWEDLVRNHLIPTFVISSKDYKRFFSDLSSDRKQMQSGLRICCAATVDDAVPFLLGQAEEVLDYLRRLRDRASQDPLLKLFPVGFQKASFFDKLHVQVRVSSERREPERDREQERRRSAGSPQSEEDDRFRKTAYRHPADESQFLSREHTEPPIPWQDAEAANRSARSKYLWAAILGDPGIGKSTLLRYEAWLTASEQIEHLQNGERGVAHVLLPFYLRLADLAGIAGQQPMDQALADLLADPQRGGLVPKSQQLHELIGQKLRDGQVVLLLDALDEIPEESYEPLARWIRGWGENYPPKRLYVTSRIVGYRGLPFLPKADDSADRFWKGELELVAFRQEDIRHYIRGVFRDVTDPQSGRQLADILCNHLQQNPSLMALTQTPLLLALICLAYVQGLPRRPPPETRCQLFRECLDGLLGRWPHVRRAETGELSEHEVEQLELRLRLVEQIAWGLFNGDPERTLFRAQEVQGALQHENCQPLLEELDWTPETARDELVQTDGILIRIGSGRGARYLFMHRSLQEYLLAGALARRSDWLQEALSHVYDPAWTNVLALLGGVLCHQMDETGEKVDNRCVRYIAALLKMNAKDILCWPLLLAGRVANETECLPSNLSSKLARALIVLLSTDLTWPHILSPAVLSNESETYAALTELVTTGNHHSVLRESAAWMLGRLGQPRPHVVTALGRAWTEDDDWQVRLAVKSALASLRHSSPSLDEADPRVDETGTELPFYGLPRDTGWMDEHIYDQNEGPACERTALRSVGWNPIIGRLMPFSRLWSFGLTTST